MEKEYAKFHIVKSYVNRKLSEKRAHICERDLRKSIHNVGLNAKVLADLLVKEINEHNSKIDATRTRLDKLKYTNHKVYQSKLIVGHNVPYRKIDQLITENPDSDWYDLYRMLVD